LVFLRKFADFVACILFPQLFIDLFEKKPKTAISCYRRVTENLKSDLTKLSVQKSYLRQKITEKISKK